MGSFKQHITCSTVTGIVLGGAAYHFGFSLPTCLLGGGLCSIAGMLPDIDSDTSRSFQECIYLAAGLSAVLWVHRLLQFDLSQDIIILNGAGMFLFVRFVVGEFIKKLTAHRGMFHSIPAAILTGEVVFFLSAGTTLERTFKAFAITAGYFSHLILDEYCSIDSTGKKLRLKKSFGTALKFIDTKRMPVTLAVYTLVVFMGITAVKNPELVERLDGSEELLAAEQAPKSSGGRLADLLKKADAGATSTGNEQKWIIQREAAEYLAQREQGVQNPAVVSSQAPQTPGSSRKKRYSELRPFARNHDPATVAGMSESGSSPLPADPVQTTMAYQRTTYRSSEPALGIPREGAATRPVPDNPVQVPVGSYAPQQSYSPPRFSDSGTAPIPQQSTPQDTATPYGSVSVASPLGIIGSDFAPRNRNFALPSREPARPVIPSM